MTTRMGHGPRAKEERSFRRRLNRLTRFAIVLSAVAASLLAVGAQAAEAAPASYRYYQIVARHSGSCLDVEQASLQDGANVSQYHCWGGTNQQWYLRPVGSGYYEVIARHSGKCLDVEQASLQDGANVSQYHCWGGTNQDWRFA